MKVDNKKPYLMSIKYPNGKTKILDGIWSSSNFGYEIRKYHYSDTISILNVWSACPVRNMKAKVLWAMMSSPKKTLRKYATPFQAFDYIRRRFGITDVNELGLLLEVLPEVLDIKIKKLGGTK